MDQDHQERIKQRAHEIWESEGRPEGRDSDHWSRAEQELRSEMGGEQPADLGEKPKPARNAAATKPKRASRKSPSPKTEKASSVNDKA